jgi:hypothetical protein
VISVPNPKTPHGSMPTACGASASHKLTEGPVKTAMDQTRTG